MLGSGILLIGCSSLTTGLSNQSTPTSAVPTPIDTTAPKGKTIPSDTSTDKTIPSDTSTDTNNSSTTGQTVSPSDRTATPTKLNDRKNTVAISKAKYNQLEYGYTYEKVKSLLGDTGDVVTESGIKGNKSYTVTYLCHVKSPSGGEVFLAFKGNKLVNKMEVNLQ
ncbi:exported hypothetical protein [Candidatus Desulfosporosinus infrequens]|uniref:DUF3862 domain-containing protein n=1 Tax=Candidatus Desulfosporosinus infrequens TaxID=2043169 RepID=A0A2U3KLK2_9FIRM|nr:exported hypothetical protein [Candidatus Desulfosporosinus infrequens]